MQGDRDKEQARASRPNYLCGLLRKAATSLKPVPCPSPSCVTLFGMAASFDAKSGDAVFCVSGAVWVTQGDGQDYILGSGETLVLAPRDRVVVVARDARSNYRFCQRGHDTQWQCVPAANGRRCRTA